MQNFPKTLDIAEFKRIAALYELRIIESNFDSYTISRISSVNETSRESLSFLNSIDGLKVPVDQIQGLVLISDELNQIELLKKIECKYLFVQDPKYFFAALVESHFMTKNEQKSSALGNVHPTAKISKEAVIEAGVFVGKNSVISAGVYLATGSVIGDNVFIKPNTVIGGSGFGYAVRRGHPPLKIPHIGGVLIGDNVDIGSCNTIDKGTFGNTVISNNVKMDNGVHIGHNTKIGERTIITAHVEISGSVKIGEDCWVAPNVSILEKIQIGNNVLIGIGSVVIKNIQDDHVVAGVPARVIRKQN